MNTTSHITNPADGTQSASLEVLTPYTGSNRYPIGRPINGGHEIVADVASQGGTPEHCRSLAVLIAAAPDLLAALQNASNVIAALITGQLKPGDVKHNGPAMTQARAAIAKATA